VHSLFNVLNQTSTSMGERNLQKWLRKPLKDIDSIHKRQKMITSLVLNPRIRNSLRSSSDRLNRFPDMERILSRLFNSTSGKSLEDLLAVYRCNIRLLPIRDDIATFSDSYMTSSSDASIMTKSDAWQDMRKVLDEILSSLEKFNALVEELVDSDRLISGKDRRFGTKWQASHLYI